MSLSILICMPFFGLFFDLLFFYYMTFLMKLDNVKIKEINITTTTEQSDENRKKEMKNDKLNEWSHRGVRLRGSQRNCASTNRVVRR